MIVSCERCGSQYRVREDKLPASGGRIKCPSCSHIFIVRPSGAGDRQGGRADGAENLAETVPPGGMMVDATRKARLPVGGPAGEADTEKEEGVGGADDNRTWKLRLGGLTYAFHSKDSLQQWLVARDHLEEVKLTKEGEAWRSLEEFPDLLTPQIKSKLARAAAQVQQQEAVAASAAAVASAEGSGAEKMGSTSPFSVPSEDDMAKARAAKAGGAAAAQARKTLAGLQAVAPPSPKRGARGGGGGEDRGGKAAPKPKGNAFKLLVIFVVLCASVVGLHVMGVINLGALVPELDNRKTTPVLQGGANKQLKVVEDPKVQGGGLDPVPLPLIEPKKDDALGKALSGTDLKVETAEERQARLEKERGEVTRLLGSSKAEDWKAAEKLLENSLLVEFPEEEGLHRALLEACGKTGNEECKGSAQAKVDAHEKRAQEKAARIAKWHQEAEQKLETKKLGDAGEALLLVKSLLEESPESIDYNKLLVEAHAILNQESERQRAQERLDGLLIAQGIRDVKAHLEGKNYDEAIRILEKELLKKDAKRVEFLELVVRAYRERGGKKDAKIAEKYQKTLDKVKEEAAP